MNKALEQKPIGPLEESIPKNNPPKQFCEWSFEQGDRKSQQDELELMLELVGDFFWEEGVCGGWNKWRGAHGAHEAGGAPRGWARPGPSWPGAGSPRCVLSATATYSQIF